MKCLEDMSMITKEAGSVKARWEGGTTLKNVSTMAWGSGQMERRRGQDIKHQPLVFKWSVACLKWRKPSPKVAVDTSLVSARVGL